SCASRWPTPGCAPARSPTSTARTRPTSSAGSGATGATIPAPPRRTPAVTTADRAGVRPVGERRGAMDEPDRGDDARVRRIVRVRGRVQGVGYRMDAAAAAERLGVAGTVRNLLDGSVEATLEGAPEAASPCGGRSRGGRDPSGSRAERLPRATSPAGPGGRGRRCGDRRRSASAHGAEGLRDLLLAVVEGQEPPGGAGLGERGHDRAGHVAAGDLPGLGRV